MGMQRRKEFQARKHNRLIDISVGMYELIQSTNVLTKN
jgi:ribosomal protein S10